MWPKNRLPREVTSEAEHVLEIMWTSRRLYVHVPTSEFPNRERLDAHSAASRNGLPYRYLSFEDRLSSDKTLPKYSVRAFLYSAMIRGLSPGTASA